MDRDPLSLRVIEALDATLRRRASPRVHRLAYRVGFRVLRPWWRLTRPRTRGAKVVVRCGGEVLLVRHAYARRDAWDVPGGYVRAAEDPAEAIVRELREELGVVAAGPPRSLGVVPQRMLGKRERLHAFRVDVADRAVSPEPAEIADVRWVAPGALPPGTTAYARRLVARAGWEAWD